MIKTFLKVNRKIVVVIFLFLFGLTLFNCTPKNVSKTEGTDSFYSAISSTNFRREITYLRTVAVHHPDPSVKKNAHLRLAFLYSSYKNPDPNYHRALKELETYASLDPEGGRRDEIQNWLAILRKLERVERENRSIREDTKTLTEENQKMKETIENLRDLDLQFEKKRKRD